MNKLVKKISVGILSLTLCGAVLPTVNSVNVFADSNGEVDVNKYLTGYLDENGEVVFFDHIGEDRSATVTIAVIVGTYLAGYLTGIVVDGIVISATGKSGGEWVASAIRSVVGKPYKGTVRLNSGAFTCPGFVIDHSGICGN